MIKFDTSNYNSRQYSPRVAPFTKQNIAFGAMNKSQFQGLDLVVVERFKAPIEKFNVIEDFQNWAKKQAKRIANTDFGGVNKETESKRKNMLKEWFDYVFAENDNSNFAKAFLVLASITEGLGLYNDELPPILNKKRLENCVKHIDRMKRSNPDYKDDLKFAYKEELRQQEWEDYYDDLQKRQVQEIKNNIKDAIKNNDAKAIFEYLGSKVNENKDGYLTLSSFTPTFIAFAPQFSNFTLKDCGIDENALFEKVEKTEGDIGWGRTSLTELRNLKSIGGSSSFNYSQITNLGKLESIGGDTYFEGSQIKDLGNLESIGGCANFINSQVKDLGNLKSIGGNAEFRKSQIDDLGNLESIGGYANFIDSQVKDLGKLKSIGGDAIFAGSQIKDLGELESIGGVAIIDESQEKDLGEALRKITKVVVAKNKN